MYDFVVEYVHSICGIKLLLSMYVQSDLGNMQVVINNEKKSKKIPLVPIDNINRNILVPD